MNFVAFASSYSLSQKFCTLLFRGYSSLTGMATHSNRVTHSYNSVKVIVLPANSDNFMYLVKDLVSNEAVVVDPVDATSVFKTAAEENVRLAAVLTTHHHWDHAGGNKDLKLKIPGQNLTIIGGDERINAVTKIVDDEEEINVGQMKIRCIHTPCHTTGHICYYVTAPNIEAPLVFTGDTLFIAGCGRFFEGTARNMHDALNEKLAKLPDETKVYCGHEYTVTNLKFARTVEPDNKDIVDKLNKVIDLRDKKEPTVPSTIGEEKRTNPFMRITLESVQCFAEERHYVKVMAQLRKKKDAFKA